MTTIIAISSVTSSDDIDARETMKIEFGNGFDLFLCFEKSLNIEYTKTHYPRFVASYAYEATKAWLYKMSPFLSHKLAYELYVGLLHCAEENEWHSEIEHHRGAIKWLKKVSPVGLHSLEELYEWMKTVDYKEWENLPSFGGDAPDDTIGVRSWDHDHLIIGSCYRDLEIVTRVDWDSRDQSISS